VRRRLVLLIALVLVIGVVVAVVVWRATSRPEFARAVALAPADTERLSWTDWDAVRREVGADLDVLGDRLEDLGYQRPDDEDGVWRGGADVVASIGPALTPELQYFALLGDGLVLTSDRPAYLEHAVDVARGDADAVEGLDDVVDASGAPVAASVFSGAYACEKLAMAQADATDQEQADALVEDAGGVHPMSAFAMSTQLDGGVRVAMAFEGDDQAREDADSRSALAAGPAPGQGGDFADRFSVESATADGSTVVLELDPVSGQYVLSDLTSGPVLFATC
jgi:hypothetical protein